MSNNLRQVKVLLYRLKRQFGYSLTIVSKSSTSTINTETGVVTPSTVNYNISKVILLPLKEIRQINTLLPANFNYGAYYDFGTRVLILEKSELPSGYVPKQSDEFTFESLNYVFHELNPLPEQKAYLIICKTVRKDS